MRTVLEPQVDAANQLTRRWCEVAGAGDFVVSGAGLWPLLGLLAAAADGPARTELEAAIGMPAETAHSAALELIDTMRYARDLSAALGVWVQRTLPLNSDWLAGLPRGTVDLITDQAALDAWADQYTDGLIKRFPLQVTDDTMLVLATALLARTSWRNAFHETTMVPESGPWQGMTLPALSRTTGAQRCVALLDGRQPVTRIVVEGRGDVDVHLLQGAGTPGEILTTGLEALAETIEVRTQLPSGTDGPGLTVREQISLRNRDQLRLTLPPFDVRSTHDLCAPNLAALFGLTTAQTDGDHFPGISPAPLSVAQGAQDVLARFLRDGFEAAAVTAISMDVSGMPPPPTEHRIRVYTATFDRPFGFLAVHRPTGLAIVAGWIATRPPEPPARTEPERTAEFPPGELRRPRPVAPGPGPSRTQPPRQHFPAQPPPTATTPAMAARAAARARSASTRAVDDSVPAPKPLVRDRDRVDAFHRLRDRQPVISHS
ncbi:serpin family protein [Nocardia cyriacigeorgica]|uniref:serpin family protein n=1 Tax=Nocardia cyriacigeorgica TaxID=135487 RepID=UPI0024565960|nr:serpin family protein [Nocardia cyriacigeorgica]